MNDIIRLKVAVVDGPQHAVAGREAWALGKLIEAGERGCTPIDQPAPRWSHYIFLLRRRGILVETIHEGHSGPFAGHHARYVLRTRLTVIETVRASDRLSGRAA